MTNMVPDLANPIATAEQFAAEADVRAMWALPEVRTARARCATFWSLAFGIDVPADMQGSFEEAMDEYVTNYLFKGAASDAFHPRFVRNFMAAYAWNGEQVPGARMGGDNPDNCYRLAGIAHGERYVVRGHPVGLAPPNVSFTLVANWGTSVTIATIENHQFERVLDGSFELTIGPDEGGANHLRTAPNVKFLFVRDSLNDWADEAPYRLEIARLGGTRRPALSIKDMAAAACHRMVEDVPLYYWFSRLWMGLPPNRLRAPRRSGAVGGLVTQAASSGLFRLGADQAAIIRFDPAGAAYAGIVCYDWWYRSIDSRVRQSSLTRASAVADTDGFYRCVLSAFDPGVANWLDSGGRSVVGTCFRWQGLPDDVQDDQLILACDIVERGDLGDALPKQSFRIDPQERATRLSRRCDAYDRRLWPG